MVLGGSCLGVVVLGDNCPRGIIALWGSCPQGSCPQGSCHRGSCPVTLFYDHSDNEVCEPCAMIHMGVHVYHYVRVFWITVLTRLRFDRHTPFLNERLFVADVKVL